MPDRLNKPSLLFGLLALCLSAHCLAHGVDSNTAHFLINNQGRALIPFLYIGGKHMVTGYDHLLFLVGVIFFLFRLRDIVIYVSLFTLGHSLTLLLGVLAKTHFNVYLIDAIIALSIVYKGFDNLNGFQLVFGIQPDTRYAVLIFGLFHGLGLATKLQDFNLPPEHLLSNLLAFNIGVELGQCIALLFILIVLGFWRRHRSYNHFSTLSNTLLMSAGLLLFGYQISAYFMTT